MTPAGRCPERYSAPMKLRIWAALGAVYLIWGSTYLAIRFAIETMPPFLMGGLRFLIAGTALFAVRRLIGDQPPVQGRVALGGHRRPVSADSEATAASSSPSSGFLQPDRVTDRDDPAVDRAHRLAAAGRTAPDRPSAARRAGRVRRRGAADRPRRDRVGRAHGVGRGADCRARRVAVGRWLALWPRRGAARPRRCSAPAWRC